MSSDQEPGDETHTDPDELATFRTDVEGGTTVIAVAGELDAASGSHLRTLLAEALEAHPSAVAVDLDDVTFIDSVGLSVLVSAHNRSQATGTHLEVRRVPAMCRRVFEITRLDEVLDLR